MNGKRRLLIALLVLAVAGGCPQGSSHQRSIDTPESPSPADELKTALGKLAETGESAVVAVEGGEGSSEIEEAFNEFLGADPDKAPSLQKDFDELKSALGSDPEKVKAKAKEIMGKL